MLMTGRGARVHRMTTRPLGETADAMAFGAHGLVKVRYANELCDKQLLSTFNVQRTKAAEDSDRVVENSRDAGK